jgi:hypothetical protein
MITHFLRSFENLFYKRKTESHAGVKLNSQLGELQKNGAMTLVKFNLSHACGCAHVSAVLCLFFQFAVKVPNSLSYSALRTSDVAASSRNTGLITSLILDIAPEEVECVRFRESATWWLCHGSGGLSQASHLIGGPVSFLDQCVWDFA